MIDPKQAEAVSTTELKYLIEQITRIADPKIVYMGGDKTRTPRVSIDAIALARWHTATLKEKEREAQVKVLGAVLKQTRKGMAISKTRIALTIKELKGSGKARPKPAVSQESKERKG